MEASTHISEFATLHGVSEKTIRRNPERFGVRIIRGMVEPVDGNTTEIQPEPAKPAPPAPKKKTAPFRPFAKPVAGIAAGILVSADALACAWIARHSYPDFRDAATLIFGLIGFAVGYSAIKNIISYKGWNGDAWAWGFGLFQLGLHLSAMQVFSEYSFYVGKIIISIGLPLAVGGLAVSLRNENN